MEMMSESGAAGMECLDPPPIGNVELEEAFERIGDDVFIKGNIDSVNVLLEASDDDLQQDILSRLKTGMKYKGFILSTACSIAPNVKTQRIQLITEIAKKYGQYS